MRVLQIVGVVLSFLLLAAHFLRSGSLVPTFVSLGMIGLLLVPRPWAARTIQVALTLGAAEWVRTLLRLAASRMRAGEPAARMILILAVVTAITLLAAFAVSRGRLAQYYRLDG